MAEDTERHEPPDDLEKAGRELWRQTLKRYELGYHELVLLKEACRIEDRLERIAAEVKNASLTAVNFKGDPVANPLLVEARQQAITKSRLIASCRLPDDDTGARPQRRGGSRYPYSNYNPDRWKPSGS